MKNTAIVILVIISIMSCIYGYMQSSEAQRQSELAMDGERRALIAEDNALMNRDRAEKFKRELEECQKNKPSK